MVAQVDYQGKKVNFQPWAILNMKHLTCNISPCLGLLGLKKMFQGIQGPCSNLAIATMERGDLANHQNHRVYGVTPGHTKNNAPLHGHNFTLVKQSEIICLHYSSWNEAKKSK